MIIIKDLDFEMEQVKSTPFFNLKLPTIVNEGKENERIDMKINGYGMPFETCIQKIVSLKLAKIDETYTAGEYMEAYVAETEKLTDLVTYIYKAPKTDTVETEEDEDHIIVEENDGIYYEETEE
jgi:hypothetical protein